MPKHFPTFWTHEIWFKFYFISFSYFMLTLATLSMPSQNFTNMPNFLRSTGSLCRDGVFQYFGLMKVYSKILIYLRNSLEMVFPMLSKAFKASRIRPKFWKRHSWFNYFKWFWNLPQGFQPRSSWACPCKFKWEFATVIVGFASVLGRQLRGLIGLVANTLNWKG